MGRVEWLRNLGVSYKEMEKQGIMLPVINLQVQFKKSALYDELLTVTTTLVKMPTVKIEFNYEILNENNEIITIGNTSLVFMDTKTKKPIKCPQYILNKLENEKC